MKNKYEIAGKVFNLTLTLRQDELLGAINHEMLEECPELMEASNGISKVQKSKRLIQQGSTDSKEFNRALRVWGSFPRPVPLKGP